MPSALSASLCTGVLVCAVACGSSSPSKGFSSTDGGSSSSSGGGASSGSGSGGSTNGPGGVITIQQSVDTMCGMPTYMGVVNAAFSDDLATLLANPACEPATTSGDCTVQICDGNMGTPSPPTGTTSAGTIDITGTSLPVMLPPNGDGSYSAYSAMSTAGGFIPPSATLQVSATGGTVPAFHTTLTFQGINVSSPVLVNSMAQLPSGAVPVTFSGGPLQVFLQAGSGTDSSKEVVADCVFTGGSGSVPASVMSMMTNYGTIALGPIETANVTAGDYAVEVKAQAFDQAGIFTK